MGVSRSATLVCAYLMNQNRDWTVSQTISYVRKRRSCVEPNTGFEIQLNAWKEGGFKCDESFPEYYEKYLSNQLVKFQTEVTTMLAELQGNATDQQEAAFTDMIFKI